MLCGRVELTAGSGFRFLNRYRAYAAGQRDRKGSGFTQHPFFFRAKKEWGEKRAGASPWTPAAAAYHQMRIGCTGIRKACVAGLERRKKRFVKNDRI